jgi:hypothetical protein
MMLQRFSSATTVSPDKSSCMGIVSKLTTSQSSWIDDCLLCIISFAGVRCGMMIDHLGARPSTVMRVLFRTTRFGTSPAVCSLVVRRAERNASSQRLSAMQRHVGV